MRFQVIALLAVAGVAIAQGVTDKIAPKGDAPDGCKPSIDGKFEIAIVELNNNGKRDLALQTRAACSSDGILVAELVDSVLTDNHQRTGYIASNYQFQFDGPPQAGAIFTAGFSHCGNGSLALGSSTVFYQCRSGSFYNLYDRWWAEQCDPVEIIVMSCGGSDEPSPTDEQASQTVVGTQVVTTTVVAPLGDGQPQVITTTTAVLICQIGDGQIQGHTTPCTAAATHTHPALPPPVSVPPVSQYSDGQIQVTPVVPAPSNQPPPPATTHGGRPGESTLTTFAAPTSPSRPASVPTSAPEVSSAGGIQGRVSAVVMVGLGIGGVVWFW